MYILSPNYSRFLFFSPPAAGLTNRGPVRDSDPGAPLENRRLDVQAGFSKLALYIIIKDFDSDMSGASPFINVHSLIEPLSLIRF